MKLAYTMAPGAGDTDLLLADVATRMAARGLVLCGTVQLNSTRGNHRKCDMDLCVLPEGPMVRISQDRGPQARGCRLNPDALEHAVALTLGRLAGDADLLLINKFGKHEAEGRGFRPVIAEALSCGVPVLVGVNAANRAAFEGFAGDIAKEVPADPAALSAWVEANLKNSAVSGPG